MSTADIVVILLLAAGVALALWSRHKRKKSGGCCGGCSGCGSRSSCASAQNQDDANS